MGYYKIGCCITWFFIMLLRFYYNYIFGKGDLLGENVDS